MLRISTTQIPPAYRFTRNLQEYNHENRSVPNIELQYTSAVWVYRITTTPI
jgi:hypothetical protein